MECNVFCPLGSKCEEIRDNKLYRCAWYIKLVGKDPQSENSIEEWGCAMAWLPVMLVEVAQTNRGTTQAANSMRDEIIKRQDFFSAIAIENLKDKKLIQGE